LTKKEVGKIEIKEEQVARNKKTVSYLSCLLTTTDLSTETGLDGCDGSSGSARVAGDEVQTVLSFVEFGVGASTGFAGNVFNCCRLVVV
jgi:hypothetical protein